MTNTFTVDCDAPVRFLRTAYRDDDSIAVLLKAHGVNRTTQRIGLVTQVATPRFQAWLRAENATSRNVYVSVNSIAPGQRSRRREAIGAVRHVFLDVDADAAGVVATIEQRRDLPEPSYIVSSSSDRAQVFWRVRDFTGPTAEALQKHLARELRADPAATSCSQLGRLPGFFNHKYVSAPLVTIEYRDSGREYTPRDFPVPVTPTPTARVVRVAVRRMDRVDRAQRYLAGVPPAVAGQHGDLLTFRVCCRLARGFALDDGDAVRVLSEWNERCQPPWSDRELRDKLRRARRYGREPVGGLLEVRP
jgi:hypothetical protein